MNLLRTDQWAEFPVRYWLRNESVLSPSKLVLPQGSENSQPENS